MKRPNGWPEFKQYFFGILLVVSLSACRPAIIEPPPFPPRSHHEFSVMSYNLRQFRYTDRDDDGQEDDFKPESEIVPQLEIIRDAQPDVLAVQEVGDESTLKVLQQRLSGIGADYPYMNHLSAPNRQVSLGILSRYPIENSVPLTNFTYSIQGRPLSVQRGFQQVDIRIREHEVVRLINVHLKSKRFHEAGQTEMRRNEARLLAAHIRRVSRESADLRLIVCGDFNDDYNSAAMREILNQDHMDIFDLPLSDRDGDRWTHYFLRDQTYSKIDYMLVNQSMKKTWVQNKSGILRDKRTYLASDHRPVLASFSVTD